MRNGGSGRLQLLQEKKFVDYKNQNPIDRPQGLFLLLML